MMNTSAEDVFASFGPSRLPSRIAMKRSGDLAFFESSTADADSVLRSSIIVPGVLQVIIAIYTCVITGCWTGWELSHIVADAPSF